MGKGIPTPPKMRVEVDGAGDVPACEVNGRAHVDEGDPTVMQRLGRRDADLGGAVDVVLALAFAYELSVVGKR